MSISNILPTVEDKELIFLLKNLKKHAYYKNKTINRLKTYFPDSIFLFFDSGRSALHFLAENVLEKNSRIALQTFTCSAVVHPFLTANILPNYLSFDKNSFNFEYQHLINYINKKTKSVLLQYTFGIVPNSLEQILNFCRKNNLIVIEDLSHSFGNRYNNRYLGNFGDFAVISFGKDKPITVGSGGCLIVNDRKWQTRLKKAYQKIKQPTKTDTAKQLFYLFFMQFAKKLYHHKVIRALIYLLQKTGLLTKAVSDKEKQLYPNKIYSINKFLYPLLYSQLKKLKPLMDLRKTNTNYWNKLFNKNYKTALLKYPLSVSDKHKILEELKQNHIYLSTWYSNLLDPEGVDLRKYRLDTDKFKQELYFAQTIINLPNLNLNLNQKKIIYSIINKYENNRD